MKKLLRLIGIVALSFALRADAGDFGYNVPTTNRVILGAPGNFASPLVTGATYVAGQRIMTNGVVFVATVGGQSGADPSFAIPAADVSNGGVIWRPCLTGKRTGLIVVNETATRVHLGLTSTSATNTGTLLIQNGSISLMGAECPQGDITAISESGLSRVGISEW